MFLNKNIIDSIQEDRRAGVSVYKLADKYALSVSTIRDIVYDVVIDDTSSAITPEQLRQFEYWARVINPEFWRKYDEEHGHSESRGENND